MDEHEQIMAWREAVNKYKETYATIYNGKQPPEGRIESFCKLYSIPWPIPRAEEQEEESWLPTRIKMKFGRESEG